MQEMPPKHASNRDLKAKRWGCVACEMRAALLKDKEARRLMKDLGITDPLALPDWEFGD